MPRPHRFCPPDHTVHVVQRGNNRQVCFARDDDYAAYAHWLCESALRYEVAIHAWVFMTNHVHLLMTPSTPTGISKLMQSVSQKYVQSFNFRYSRSGTLFEGRFRSSLVQSEAYLLNCIRYIELNPVRAGMTTNPGDYHWSSFHCHAFNSPATMWTPHPEFFRLGRNAAERAETYRMLVREALPTETVQKIRGCLNSGLALGSDNFREQIEALRS